MAEVASPLSAKQQSGSGRVVEGQAGGEGVGIGELVFGASPAGSKADASPAEGPRSPGSNRSDLASAEEGSNSMMDMLAKMKTCAGAEESGSANTGERTKAGQAQKRGKHAVHPDEDGGDKKTCATCTKQLPLDKFGNGTATCKPCKNNLRNFETQVKKEFNDNWISDQQANRPKDLAKVRVMWAKAKAGVDKEAARQKFSVKEMWDTIEVVNSYGFDENTPMKWEKAWILHLSEHQNLVMGRHTEVGNLEGKTIR